MEKKYWKGLDELKGDVEFVEKANNEFPEEIPVDEVFSRKSEQPATPRRDFLKFMGFSLATATLASCEAPVRKTIPYLIRPEEIVPGVANWYASTFSDGNDYCSIVVKTREGRPIKIEGNKRSSVTRGGVNARVQASVLSLYDSARLQGPLAGGAPSSWQEVDGKIKEKLQAIAAKNGNIRILSSTIISPSTNKVIADFTSKYPSAKHITYDAVSYSAIIKANQASFGKAVIPSYKFDKAETIVSFAADFLNSWISPVEFANQYVQNRKLRGKKTMSRHIQYESSLSLTGSNADKRIQVKPSEQGIALLNLYNRLAAFAGASTVKDKPVRFIKSIEDTAQLLWKNKGKALVVCGVNDIYSQIIVNAVNKLLDSYGNTIDIENPCCLKQGNDADLAKLMEEIKAGEVSALITYNTNPVYTLPGAEEFKTALQKKVELKISFADRADETAALADFVCPDHHYLEAWNDAEPAKGHYSLAQPAIRPLFKTRAAQESLLKWAGVEMDYHNYIQDYWKANLFNTQSKYTLFETFWTDSLQNGVFDSSMAPAAAKEKETPENKKNKSKNKAHRNSQESGSENIKIDLEAASEGILRNSSDKNGDWELVLYEKAGLGNGSQANNPWLQELPDPVSKVTWDNYVTMSPADMRGKYNLLERGDNTGDVITLTLGNTTVKAPVYPQPGQMPGTIGLALGYGRTKTGKVANNVGVNAFPFVQWRNETFQYTAGNVSIGATADKHEFAATQTHHTMMGRALVKETTLSEYIKDPKAGNEEELFVYTSGKESSKKKSEELNLWDTHEKPVHRWGMVIDLNSCIGCGACVIGCQAENNVPVVGKDEVMRSREMHWIRIDRYYSSDMNAEKGKEEGKGSMQTLREMESPSDNPEVVFQPVMCQHCNHAPCETVCPVLATTHSSEGMNQMIYNRCVGTRYCANNCPYKVRRFNWFKYSDNKQFDYNMNDNLGKMVLNPDVVVRSRGVMEKCSLCVQRIQEGKLNAKKENRKVKDGDIQTACAQSCPTNAIVFGDYNDPASEIGEVAKDERCYHLLGEIDTQPNIYYQTKVRNTPEEKA